MREDCPALLPFQKSKHPKTHGQTWDPVSNVYTSPPHNKYWYHLQRDRWVKEVQRELPDHAHANETLVPEF